MTIQNSIMLCSSQTPEDGWEYMAAHQQSFIWSDDEDPIGTWNRQLGEVLGAVADEPMPGGNGSQQLAFRDRIVDVQLQFNRDDRFRLLHGLARVTHLESDIRLCLGSTHSSDVAFLAMPWADWKSLESRFGVGIVDSHFLSLNCPFDEFMEAAFTVPDVPPSRLAPEMTDWEGGGSYQPHKLDYMLVNDGPGLPRLKVLQALVDQYLEAGPVTVTFSQIPSKLHIDRNDLVAKITDRLGEMQIRVSNLTCTGFLVIEPNGVAAGWRTDGWHPPRQLSPQVPTKWWQFWKRGNYN